MRILVLQGSPRKDGGTRAMVEAFRQGAEKAGNEVVVFDVANMDIAGCRACEWCHTKGDGGCIQQDDMGAIYGEWNRCDMLVLASPVYYGSPTGQLLCALHRTYALGIPKKCERTAMILCSGAKDVYDASRSIYKGFVQGYFGCKDMGVYTATTAQAKSAAKQNELFAFGASLA